MLFFEDLEFINRKFKNVKKIFKSLQYQAIKEKMSLGELSLIWIFKQKEIDKIIFGVDSLLHLQTNIKTIKKNLSNETNKIIKRYNLHNNKIIKPYLWKIK